MLRALIIIFGLMSALLMPSVAYADSWFPAQVETYFSEDKNVRVTVTPRQLEDALAYFEDKVEEREPAGQKAGGNDKASMLLERKTTYGEWQTVWKRTLPNDVAPVSVLLSRTGRYVASFDNWHSMGHGDNVVVIYGPDGNVIRSLRLDDFLPKSYIAALPRSVSSLRWSGQHRISKDETTLTLEVTVPEVIDENSDSPPRENPKAFVEISFDLATGTMLPIDSVRWQWALSAVERVNARNWEWEQKRKAYLTSPLLGPSSNDEGDWHQYLREAFLRITADWKEDSTWTTVLRLPTAADYKPSRKWIRERLQDTYGDNVAFATLSPSNFIDVLRKEVAVFKPGRLNHLTIYLALEEPYWNEALQILKPTGAKLVQIDPAKPIPQNPERLKAMID
jgi:hypothetical protein